MAAPALFPVDVSRRQHAIVLVHGAWVGEWCWEPLIPLLEASGRRVIAVSLMGHGARSAESGPHITLDDHVSDLVGVLETLDLTDATVVGHSYGGRVITKAWPRMSSRVERLVYLDAHAPFPEAVPPPTAPAPEGGGPPEMVPFASYEPKPEELGGQDAVTWFMERLVDHAPLTLQQDFMHELPTEIAKSYVFANGDPNSRFTAYAAAAKAASDWDYHEVGGSHWVMFNHPEQVTEIILRSP